VKKYKEKDVERLIEAVLDLSLTVIPKAVGYGTITVECPVCGVRKSDDGETIEDYPHDEECGYMVAMKMYKGE